MIYTLHRAEFENLQKPTVEKPFPPLSPSLILFALPPLCNLNASRNTNPRITGMLTEMQEEKVYG